MPKKNNLHLFNCRSPERTEKSANSFFALVTNNTWLYGPSHVNWIIIQVFWNFSKRTWETNFLEVEQRLGLKSRTRQYISGH